MVSARSSWQLPRAVSVELRPESCSARRWSGLQATVTCSLVPGDLVNTRILIRRLYWFPVAAVSSAQLRRGRKSRSSTALCRRLEGRVLPCPLSCRWLRAPPWLGATSPLASARGFSPLVPQLPPPPIEGHWWWQSGVTVTGGWGPRGRVGGRRCALGGGMKCKDAQWNCALQKSRKDDLSPRLSWWLVFAEDPGSG